MADVDQGKAACLNWNFKALQNDFGHACDWPFPLPVPIVLRFVFRQLLIQPSLGVCPVAIGRPNGNGESGRRLLDGQPREIAQSDHFGCRLILACESSQCLVERQDIAFGLFVDEF